MKIAELKHVKIVNDFLEKFFSGSYQAFSISGASTSKKNNNEKEGLSFTFDLTEELPCSVEEKGKKIAVLDSPSYSSIFKTFLESMYHRKISYLNADWSGGFNKKNKDDKYYLSVSVDFKFE